jgi:maleylpyruvate isomerase
MTVDPFVLMPVLDTATRRLMETVQTLTDADVLAPSMLPGWSRGHVLSHVARNADSLCHLLDGAPQYPSAAAREQGINAGAGRGPSEQLADIRTSAARLETALSALRPEEWIAPSIVRDGTRVPPVSLVWGRLREVEIHHVDLDVGYTPDDWDTAFSLRLLHELETTLTPAVPLRLAADDAERTFHVGTGTSRSNADSLTTVHGNASALAAWLTGRSSGATLRVQPDGPLPTVPNWK